MNVTTSIAEELRKMVETSLCPGIERELGLKLVWVSPSEWTWVEREGYCPTCGSTDCPNLKNAAAMCPGPAP